MTIHRLLAIAGLLAIGACSPGPLALCVAEPNTDTEETVCAPERTVPTLGDIAAPIDEDPWSASVQR